MACLLISSASFCDGETIAARAAENLGYRLLDWETVRETAARYPTSRRQLDRALLEPPSFFGISSGRRASCLAYVTAALIEALVDDDVVYLGPQAALLIRGIPHLIRMSIAGDPGKRATRAADERSISPARAARLIAADDRGDDRLSELVFHVDPNDPTAFDVIADVSEIGIDGTIDAAVAAACSPRFQRSTYSARRLQDAVLAAQVKAAIIHRDQAIQVNVDQAVVTVRPRVNQRTREKMMRRIREDLASVGGIESLNIDPVIEIPGRIGFR